MRGSPCIGAIGVRTVAANNTGSSSKKAGDSDAIRIRKTGNAIASAREAHGTFDRELQRRNRERFDHHWLEASTPLSILDLPRRTGERRDREHEIAVERSPARSDAMKECGPRGAREVTELRR